MNYNLYAGGLSDHMTFETLGAATIPFGVGNSQSLLEMMQQIDHEVAMWSTPSYAVRLAEVAAQMEIAPFDVELRKGFFLVGRECRCRVIGNGSKTPGDCTQATSTAPGSLDCVIPGPSAARTKAGFVDALERDYSSAMRLEELAAMDCFRCAETQKAFADFLKRRKR